MNIDIRIKVRGKWFAIRKTGRSTFDYPCDKCRFKRTCWNDLSEAGRQIQAVCNVFGYGFKEVKNREC